MSVFALLLMILFQVCNRLLFAIDWDRIGLKVRIAEWLWSVAAIVIVVGSVYLAAKAERVWARQCVEHGSARNIVIWIGLLVAIPLALVLFIVVTCA